MTIEDLLRHTSGLVYPDLGNAAGRKLYGDSFARDSTLKEFVSRLARLVHLPV